MSRFAPQVRKLLPTLALLTSVLFAYIWISTHSLLPYSLQAFAAAALTYLVLKRMRRAKLWHLLPEANSLEMTLLTFAFLVLIGATGNTQSPVFFLGYVHLFFLTLTTPVPSTLAVTSAVLLFHLSLAPTMGAPELQALITIPVLLGFFLFAKHQYDEARLDRKIIAEDAVAYQKLQKEEESLEVFLQQFLQPKLVALESLAQEESQLKTLRNQLSLLQAEIAKLLQRSR